jgi:hypothetical protein
MKSVRKVRRGDDSVSIPIQYKNPALDTSTQFPRYSLSIKPANSNLEDGKANALSASKHSDAKG